MIFGFLKIPVQCKDLVHFRNAITGAHTDHQKHR